MSEPGTHGGSGAPGGFPLPVRTPVSTYRVQLRQGFGFPELRDVVPYLAELGISEAYCSPFLHATTGSTHGYDICSHDRLNPDLGGESDFDALCAELSRHGLGLVLDFVPNHMAVDPSLNAWWRDVLENGPASPYADFFDIDWRPVKGELENRILLPVLGDQYGLVLERGELKLALDDGRLVLRYGSRTFPLNPRQSPRVFRPDLERLSAALGDAHADVREFLSILTALQNLPGYTDLAPERVTERQREKEVARERLARLLAAAEPVRRFVDECIQRVNGTPGVPESFGALHDLLEAQAYRLASWRTAFDEINYRRFFDINDLAGLRMESPRVFDLTHRLVLRYVAEGKVTGIRIDHPDGLFDPAAYFARLQDAAGEALRERARDEGIPGELDTARPIYLAVEKILSPGETLRPEWRVHGTTGYGYLNLLNGLFVDGSHAERLRRIWRRFTGRRQGFPQIAYEAKRLIMTTSMASELNMLAHAINIRSEASWRSRDFTLNSLRKALMEVIASFPVYRTYVSPAGSSAPDRSALDKALMSARRRNPTMDRTIFGFIRDVLLPDDSRGTAMLPEGPDRYVFAMKFQQYSGPVHAKGVEDTAFYRYAVLLSANEVGGEPERLGTAVAAFHHENSERLARWPLDMLATATHDTKRGEDGRARLNVISEMPEVWRRAVSGWMRINAPHRQRLEGEPAPDRNDEYLFYQALVGVWPAEPEDAALPPDTPDDLVERLSAYMSKATKEAKLHTSWINPGEGYDRAVSGFVRAALASHASPRFLASFVPFARRVARLGMVNSLAQVVLKNASPGVPDLYQGCELWDLSLVDPDNRRPVDFGARRDALAELRPLFDCLEADDAGTPRAGCGARDAAAQLLASWPDGRIKLFTTARLLRLRRRHPEVFLRGDYVPLAGDDLAATHLVAFARSFRGKAILAVAPRWTSRMPDAPRLPLGLQVWKGSRLFLPAEWRGSRLRNLLTGEQVQIRETGGHCWAPVGEVLNSLPVGWLMVSDV